MSIAIELENLDKNLIIRFNRPKIRSPLSVFVIEELNEILDAALQNKAIGKIVFTGKEDVFASGADLREIAEVNETNAKEFARRGQNLMNKLANTNKLTIAAINGFCFGGALDLSLACQKRIANPNAEFSHPGANLGIMTGWGGTQRLPRLIGEAFSLEMLLTAKRINAKEALRIGLIDKIDENPLRFALQNFQ